MRLTKSTFQDGTYFPCLSIGCINWYIMENSNMFSWCFQKKFLFYNDPVSWVLILLILIQDIPLQITKHYKTLGTGIINIPMSAPPLPDFLVTCVKLTVTGTSWTTCLLEVAPPRFTSKVRLGELFLLVSFNFSPRTFADFSVVKF